MSAETERRSRLLALKLRALIRDHLGLSDDPAGDSHVFGLGAAFTTDNATWILIDGDAGRSLGPALAWSSRFSQPLRLLVENSSGLLARRTQLFDLSQGQIDVWHVDDRHLLPAIAEDHLPRRQARAEHLVFADMISAAGADVVVEHGVVAGEVRGLEMCRVVDDATLGAPRLEVGMGVHDREAFAMVHGHMPTEDALRQVIDAVIPHRTDGAPQHPLNQFGAERLARWRALNDPDEHGFQSLTAIEPPVMRVNLKDAVPCAARGVTIAGDEAVAVFAHGVDLDVVSFAADALDREGVEQGVIFLRSQDVVPSIERLASASRRRLEVVSR